MAAAPSATEEGSGASSLLTQRLVVIGGDAAGMSAASQARKRRPRKDLEILVFERSKWISYSACGEPYFIGGEVGSIDQLLARSPERFVADEIDVRIHHDVIDLDVGRRIIAVRHERGVTEVGFDHLVHATGAASVVPTINEADAEGVYTLRTLDDATHIKAAAATASTAVVVGGGYIGLEVAEAFHGLGIDTTLVTSGGQLMNRSLDGDMGAIATESIVSQGIAIHTGIRVDCLVGSEGRVTGVEADGDVLPADIVVLGVGARPEVVLAKAAGIPLGPTGAIAVDERQQTAIEGIWAAGDCAEAANFLTGKPSNPLLGTVANKQGRVAGINIGGGNARFPGVLNTAITKCLGTEIARTGLGEEEAGNAGLRFASGTVQSSTIAGYMPGASPMTVKALCERSTGRLLGAQIVGGAGSAKRIDTFVAAIWGGLSGHDLAMADLSYAPPFSGVWDPVMIAARRAADRALNVMT